MKKSEYYKDILTYIEARLDLISAMESACKERDYHRQQFYLNVVERKQQQINKWLSEDVKS